MARKRDLHPDFFHNEDLAKLHPLTRILFEGLWCWADREGRLEDRPARIKAEILPYDDHDVEAALAELDRDGFIVRYESRGLKCIWVVKFLERQRPHPQERASQLPRCASDRRSAKQLTTSHQGTSKQLAQSHLGASKRLKSREKEDVSKAGSSCDLDLAPSTQDLPEKQNPPAPKPRGRTEAPPWLVGFRDRALKEWQSRGGDGEWTKADFVAIAEAVKGYHKRDPATAEARLWASWLGFLDDPWDGFAGHYPRQWGHQAARWPARASPNLPKRTAANVAAVNEYLEGVQRERKSLGAGQTATARHSPGGDG